MKKSRFFWEVWVINIAVDTLAATVTRTSAAMVENKKDMKVFIFHEIATSSATLV